MVGPTHVTPTSVRTPTLTVRTGRGAPRRDRVQEDQSQDRDDVIYVVYHRPPPSKRSSENVRLRPSRDCRSTSCQPVRRRRPRSLQKG